MKTIRSDSIGSIISRQKYYCSHLLHCGGTDRFLRKTWQTKLERIKFPDLNRNTCIFDGYSTVDTVLEFCEEDQSRYFYQLQHYGTCFPYFKRRYADTADLKPGGDILCGNYCVRTAFCMAGICKPAYVGDRRIVLCVCISCGPFFTAGSPAEKNIERDHTDQQRKFRL